MKDQEAPGRSTPYVILALFVLSLLAFCVALFARALAGSDLSTASSSEGEIELVLAIGNFVWIGLASLGLGLRRKKLVDVGFVAFALNFLFWLPAVGVVL